MKKNDSKNRKHSLCTYRNIWLLICLFTVPGQLSARDYLFRCPDAQHTNQEQETSFLIRGKVTDLLNVPVPGVTVRVGTSNTGTSTDNNGAFTLRLTEPTGQLTFSCVGYKTVTADYRDGTLVTVRLAEDVNELEAVTVVAYGSQKRSDISGSVSTVAPERLRNKPTSNVLNLIKGSMAGVMAKSNSGDPSGNDISVIIRGANDLSIAGNRNPLFVIDGVIASDDANMKIGGNPLTSLNPEDIETFTVLKDAASAAIYGSRAANGVIVITTRHGQYDQPAQFTANVSYTYISSPCLQPRLGGNEERRGRLQALQNYADVYLDAATNTYRYADSYELGQQYDYFWNAGNGADMTIYTDSLNPFYNNSTDLMDYYFNSGHALNANIQARGGAKSVAYSVGLGFYDETGTLRNTGNKRFNAFSNLTFKPAKNLSGNFRFYLAYTNNKRASKGVDMFNVSDYNYSTIPDFLLTTSTVLPGPGTPFFDELSRRYESTKEKNDSYKLRTSFDLTYEILYGLKVKSTVSIDFLQNNQNIFKPREVSEYDETYSSGAISRHLMLLNENFITYDRTFSNVHELSALLGFSVQQDEMNNLGGFGRGAASNAIHYVTWPGTVYDSDNSRNLKDFTSDFEKKTMVGVFGRVNYNYLKRYYAGITLRRDASSTFGDRKRWGWFPSFFTAWTFTNEPFMEGANKIIDLGKIRFSYGKTGRIFEKPYLKDGEYVQTGSYMGQPTIEPEIVSGVTNHNLTWEKTSEYDAGIDLGLFGNRIGITVDYYLKQTRGLLFNPSVPGTHTGFIRPWRNMYGIDNEGIEFELRADLIRNDRLRWDVSFNISKNTNRLTRSQNDRDFQNPDYRFMDNISVIGMPLYGIYAYRDGGIYQAQGKVPHYWDRGVRQYLSGSGNAYYRPGDRIIKDIDGNGKIYNYTSIAEDRVYIGSPLPKFQGGISTNLKWKGFDVNAMFNFVCKKWVLNAAKGASLGTSITVNPSDMARPYLVSSLDGLFWEKPGDTSPYPANRADVGLSNFATNLESNAQQVSYLKSQALTVGYTFTLKAASLRLFASGENLFTVTNSDIKDPEVIDQFTGIYRNNAYPLAPRYTIGLTLNF